MKVISTYLSEFIINTNSIENDYDLKEIISFGTEVLVVNICNILAAFILAILCGKGKEAIIFLLFYCTIRSYSGGFHANNSNACVRIFSLIFLCVVWMEIYLSDCIKGMYLMILILGSTYWKYAPLGTKNNPIPKCIKDRRRVLTLIIFLMLLIVSNFLGKRLRYYALSAILVNEVLLLIGKMKER